MHQSGTRLADVRAFLGGAGLLAVQRTLGVLPTGASSGFGGFLGRRIGPKLYPAAHARAAKLLRTLQQDLSDDGAVVRAVGRMWEHMGRAYAEFATEHRLLSEGRVAFDGERLLEEARASGRPVIVAGLHTGNWELLPMTTGWLGCDIVQVFQPQPGRAAETVARRTRWRAAHVVAAHRGVDARVAFRLIPPSRRAGTDLAAAIRSGFTAVIFVDEDPGGKCVSPNLFGPPAPGGNLLRVVRLARLTGAAIVPAYVERLAGARFVVRFLPPIEASSRVDAAAELNAALAGPARRLADQWFMLPAYRARS